MHIMKFLYYYLIASPNSWIIQLNGKCQAARNSSERFPKVHISVYAHSVVCCGYNWTDKKFIYKWNECDIVLMLAESENATDPHTHQSTHTAYNTHTHTTIISFQSVYPSAQPMTLNPFVLFVVETNYMYDGV